VTIIISALGVAGRMAGDLLTTALGWASNLLFGRVPQTHRRYVTLMMAGSFLWLILLLGLLIPSIATFYLAATPHPPFVDHEWLGMVLLVGAVGLPPMVGLAGALVPADGARRPTRLAAEMARGYVIAPVLVGLLVFLAGVGLARKVRSRRHGWSDVHVAIVSETGRYDELVEDVLDGLHAAGLEVRAADAPRILNAPGWILARVSGENVRRLRPDRLVELIGRNLRVGVYPSDIAISGTTGTRVRARAAVLGRLVASSAHLTTTAEAQRLEDDLRDLVAARQPHVRTRQAVRAAFEAIDAELVDLAVPTDEWDVLYRLRLQAERDMLIGQEPGMAFPGARPRTKGGPQDAAEAATAPRDSAAETTARRSVSPAVRRRSARARP
jgi:hypothetical protein